MTSQGACTACGTCVRDNPLVRMGRIPPELADVLWVPPETRRFGRKRARTEGKVMTAEEEIKRMREELEKPKELAVQKEQKKQEREEKRTEKQAREAQLKEQKKQERENKNKRKSRKSSSA